MSSSSTAVDPQKPGLKTCFKTSEGRYKLQYEKTQPDAVLHYSHGKAVSQLTIAYLKEKPTNQASAAPSTPSSSGVMSAAARLHSEDGSFATGFGIDGSMGVPLSLISSESRLLADFWMCSLTDELSDTQNAFHSAWSFTINCTSPRSGKPHFCSSTNMSI